MRGKNSPAILVSFLIWTCFQATGQFRYETFTSAQGLSQGYIWDLLQDKDGFLWMTTKDGVNRYDGYSFKVYHHDAYDSLTIRNNDVGYLMEDHRGRIWVSSRDGFDIFDKISDRFHRLSYPRKQPHSTFSITYYPHSIELTDGRVLINGADQYFDLVTVPDHFFNKRGDVKVEYIPKPEISYGELVFKDNNQQIWYRVGHHLYQLDLKNKSFELRKDIDGFNKTYIDKAGISWTNDAFMSRIDGTNLYPTFIKNELSVQDPNILVEENGRLWTAYVNLNKLKVYDLSKWQKDRPLDPKTNLIYEDDNVCGQKLYKDKTGLIWMGLNGHGLRKYSFENEKFHHIAQNHSIRMILNNPPDGLRVVAWDGVFNIDSSSQLILKDAHYGFGNELDFFISKSGDFWETKRSDLKSSVISQIEKTDFRTHQKKIYQVHLKGLYNHSQHITEDQKGRLWFGGTGGNVAVFDPMTETIKEFRLNATNSLPLTDETNITTIYHDPMGIAWIGTEAGFAKVESPDILITTPKVTGYANELTNRNSLNENHIATFLDDPVNHDLLWIGTKGGGLNLLDKNTGTFTHITTAQGLCNDVVYGLLPDEKGNIWGSTNNGLFCLLANTMRKDNFEFRHFTEAAGLQAAEFNTDAYRKLPNGDLAFGGVNGLNVFNPKEILVDTFMPSIFITKIQIGNKLIRAGDETGILSHAIEYTRDIRLSHAQDVFTLEFSSLDFRAPDQNKYRYQLVGADDTWVESGNRRVVTYSHLPAGHYTFKVQGSNSLGIWNNQLKELSITKLPPWYASMYAYLLYAALLGLGVRTYYRYKLHQTQMTAQLQFEQNETQRIKELDKVKTHLYTNMTHEFRTPLTVILGMVQQIRRSAADHLETGLDMIERNGNNLLRLINEMLDLSKLEAGKMELKLIEGDVINFIRYIVESFHSIAESQEKKMHYLSSIDFVIAKYDAEKLRQIITNLLSNALKFTPKKGDIYISISLENDRNLSIKIKDTGIGIPEDQLLHIFDRFYQGDSSHTRKAEGTGIGLALTKELVQLMNGTISVKSPPVGAKIGSEFSVILPVKIIHESGDAIHLMETTPVDFPTMDDANPPTQLQATNMGNSKKELILLVEDHADVVAYTASCLQDYRLAVAKDGQEGFDIATGLVPDLIITDVMMPNMDGYEMTQKLRQDERTSHIPIIMLTAKADMDSRLEGIEHGAEVYLEKPFYEAELKIRIKKMLEQRSQLQKIYSQWAGIKPLDPILEDPTIPAKEPIPISVIESEFIKKIRFEIEKNLSDENFSVEQLSKNIFMSYSQVHRKLSAITGISPNQYIRQLRLQKACELLKTTELSIAQIAQGCGFSDGSYFGKVFKQEYGKTPMEWRVS